MSISKGKIQMSELWGRDAACRQRMGIQGSVFGSVNEKPVRKSAPLRSAVPGGAVQ